MAISDLEDEEKAQIFVSYAGPDRPLVKNFVRRARDDALDAAAVFWMDSQLEASRAWEQQLLERLASADVVLVMASPEFFASAFCMNEELPIIRERMTTRPSTVCVIRLRPVEFGGLSLDGATPWPSGPHALESVDPPAADWAALRLAIKEGCCAGLLARHDQDTLAWIAEAVGRKVGSPRTMAAAALMGSLVGAGAGAAAHVLLSAYPGHGGALTTLSLFALIATSAGLKAWLVGLSSLLLESDGFRERMQDLGECLRLGLPALPFALLDRGVIWTLLVGVPFSLSTLWLGWPQSDSLSVALLAGMGVLALDGAAQAMLNAPRHLQIFLDTGIPAISRLPARPSESPSGWEYPLPIECDRVPESVSPPARRYDEAEETQHRSETAEDVVAAEPVPSPRLGEDDLTAWNPVTAVDVPRQLTVVGSSTRPELTSEFLCALRAEHTADLFVVVTLTDDDQRALDPEFWRAAMSREGCCLLLVTRQTNVIGLSQAMTAARATEDVGSRTIYPVLVDAGVSNSAWLLKFQGLPPGQMAIEDWPIRENAWKAVTRSLLEQKRGQFIYRLDRYLEQALLSAWLDRIEPVDPTRTGSPTDYDRYFGSPTFFVEPRYERQRYPLAHRRLRVDGGDLVVWLILGSASFVLGDLAAGSVGAGLALLLAAACLTLRDTVAYARARMPFPRNHPLSILDIIVRVDSGKSGPVLRRAAVLFARAAAGVIFPMSALFIWPGALASGSSVIGVLASAMGYLCSRPRTLSVLDPLPIPSPHDVRAERTGWTWRLRTPRANHPEKKRARIGVHDSPEPKLIEAVSIGMNFSAAMVLRALADAIWMPLVSYAMAFVCFALSGQPWAFGVGFMVGLLLIQCAIKWRFLPLLFGRFGGSIAWEDFISPTLKWLTAICIMLIALHWFLPSSGRIGLAIAGLVPSMVTFGRRLWWYMAHSSREIRNEDT
jgi:hypothetical protein